jgi:hypothetical protein
MSPYPTPTLARAGVRGKCLNSSYPIVALGANHSGLEREITLFRASFAPAAGPVRRSPVRDRIDK